eukprot:3721160-Prymnesium_polylepis.1
MQSQLHRSADAPHAARRSRRKAVAPLTDASPTQHPTLASPLQVLNGPPLGSFRARTARVIYCLRACQRTRH